MQQAQEDHEEAELTLYHYCKLQQAASRRQQNELKGLAIYSANAHSLIKTNGAFRVLLGLKGHCRFPISDLIGRGLLPELTAGQNSIRWRPPAGAYSTVELHLQRVPQSEHRELWHLERVLLSTSAPGISFVDETDQLQTAAETRLVLTLAPPPKTKKPPPRMRPAWQKQVITMRNFIRSQPPQELLEFEPAPSPYIYPAYPLAMQNY